MECESQFKFYQKNELKLGAWIVQEFLLYNCTNVLKLSKNACFNIISYTITKIGNNFSNGFIVVK